MTRHTVQNVYGKRKQIINGRCLFDVGVDVGGDAKGWQKLTSESKGEHMSRPSDPKSFLQSVCRLLRDVASGDGICSPGAGRGMRQRKRIVGAKDNRRSVVTCVTHILPLRCIS